MINGLYIRNKIINVLRANKWDIIETINDQDTYQPQRKDVQYKNQTYSLFVRLYAQGVAIECECPALELKCSWTARYVDITEQILLNIEAVIVAPTLAVLHITQNAAEV